MTTSPTLARVPRGVPTGGQFAASAKGESGTSLDVATGPGSPASSPARRVGKSLKSVLPAALAVALLPAFVATPVRAEDRAANDRPAVASLRVADLNTNFDLSTSAWMKQMRQVAAQKPDVVLLQEVQWRDRPLAQWAKANGYTYVHASGDAKQESTVLWKRVRFTLDSSSHRLGSRAVKRAGGETIDARYLTTVRLRDKRTGQKYAFTSTHAVPEVQWWPDQTHQRGAPKPFTVTPRTGTKTLAAFRHHVRAIDAQTRADERAGYTPIVGADLNAGQEYEADWAGFQTDVFGDRLTSNHAALGTEITHTSETSKRTIDYIYAATGDQAAQFSSQKTVNTPSDHHLLITNFKAPVKKKR